MIRNYFKIAWRNLKKKSLYTFINIIGLYTGISFALLIAVFVWQELQGNKDLRNADSQYILTNQWKDPNMGLDFATLGPLAKLLKEEYPHLVADYYRWDGITSIVSKDTKKFRENIQLGDESFLDMYGFDVLHGNPSTAFKDPFSVVITTEKAIQFFGKTDVVGGSLTIQNNEGEHHQFTITGVLAKAAENSVALTLNKERNHFFIAKNSAPYFKRANFQEWENPIYACYVELQVGVNANQLEDPLKNLIHAHTSETIRENLTVIPVKLTDYYLNRNNGRLKQMLYTLSFVGLFIILMAMINFINITINHSGSRVKEIGVRKVLGGKRKQLIVQFLVESIILVTIATILAFASYPFLSNWFAKLVGKELIHILQFPVYFLCIPFVFIMILSLLAGFYPAFVLSSFKSIDALQEKIKTRTKGVYLRKFLLGFQYITALVVLIAALIVTQQLDSFFGKGLGYDKEYVVTASAPRNWTPEGVNKMLTLRNEFAKLPSVESASLSYEIPNGNNGFQTSIYRAGENPEEFQTTQGLQVDENYLKTYQIPLLAGTFLESGETNSNLVVINQKALYAYGFKNAEEAIGEQLHITNSEDILMIKGVISDFHFGSMQEAIKPQVFFNVSTNIIYRYFSFRLAPTNINKSLTEIEEKWRTLMPNSPFEYTFMDDTLATLYETELQLKKATYTASLLSLIMALLGIFGMVALSINKRIKEVSIRKVLGASASEISFLFIKEFLVILGVSIGIACPLAYLLMDQWLANYAYRITIGITPFLTGIIFIGSITVLLILFQTLKVAFSNPIKSLKTE